MSNIYSISEAFVDSSGSSIYTVHPTGSYEKIPSTRGRPPKQMPTGQSGEAGKGEKDRIIDLLSKHNGDIKQVAIELDVSYAWVYSRMVKYGIDRKWMKGTSKQPATVRMASAGRPVKKIPGEGDERDVLLALLKRHNGNKKEAAAEVGMTVRTLYNKLKKHSFVDRRRKAEPGSSSEPFSSVVDEPEDSGDSDAWLDLPDDVVDQMDKPWKWRPGMDLKTWPKKKAEESSSPSLREVFLSTKK